jgi:hypothetical protein
MAVWFITVWHDALGQVQKAVTARLHGSAIDKVHAEHAGKLSGALPFGDPPDVIDRALTGIVDDDERATLRETSYRDRAGFRHGVFVRLRVPDQEDAVREISATKAAEIDAAIASSNIQLAAKLDLERTQSISCARMRVMHEATGAMHRRFPQWSKWHAEDEARGIVRSDAARETGADR